ncbi:molecular chaperone [Escherichia coli]|nr:molecular chaperone [Escherichia coli]
MKTQPATGETYPKSDLFNKANKMPYHVTLGYIGTNGITMLPQTQSLMVTPYSHADTQFKNVPSAFQVGYINDFGGLSFYEINCPTVNNSCNVSVAKRDK